MDSDTCTLCGSLDGKVYRMADQQIGLTAPPFHPWCRCTIAPHYKDLDGIGDRWATDAETGKNYKVPTDMTYEQ